MKNYIDSLNELFKKPGMPNIIGQTISTEKLLEIGLVAGIELSPIDNNEFVESVINTKDETKIKLILSFSGSYILNNSEILNSKERLLYFFGNKRISCGLNESQKLILLEELDNQNKKINPKNLLLSDIVRSFLMNPILDRRSISDMISGEKPFEKIPTYQRFLIGEIASKVNYIDDSYSGQEYP